MLLSCLFLFYQYCSVDGTENNSEIFQDQAWEIVAPSILRDLTKSEVYDKLMAPGLLHGVTTPVAVSFYVEGLSSVHSTNMDYALDVYMRTEWMDDRLAYKKMPKLGFITTNDEDIVDRVWFPDIYFANAKQANYLYVTTPNSLFRVYPNGSVYSSRRIMLLLTCRMKLQRYPADEQHCPMKLLTYFSTTDIVNVTWRWGDSSKDVSLEPTIELPDFEIIGSRVDYCDGQFITGMYSCLICHFVFNRFIGFYVFQLFLPSGAVVSISWINFWISPRAVPARATLSITTFLALSTQTSGIRVNLPAVSYATAVDVWSTICTVFVYGALLEFALAYHCFENEEVLFKTRFAQKAWLAKIGKSSDGNQEVKTKRKWLSWSWQWAALKKNFLSSNKVDRNSRIIFPVAFAICNLCFWLYYLPNPFK